MFIHVVAGHRIVHNQECRVYRNTASRIPDKNRYGKDAVIVLLYIHAVKLLNTASLVCILPVSAGGCGLTHTLSGLLESDIAYKCGQMLTSPSFYHAVPGLQL